MQEDKVAALVAFRQAIRLEIEGRDFYTEAAHTTGDPKGRDSFLLLARNEGNHLELVQKQYESLKGTGEMYEFLAAQKQDHFNSLMLRYEAIAGPVGWRY